MPIPIPSICWFVVLVALLALEAATVGLVSPRFAVGSLCALLMSSSVGNIQIQFVIFLAVSFLYLVIIHPLAKKYADLRRVSTNAGRVIGVEGVIAQTIDSLRAQGRTIVNGAPWTARTKEGCPTTLTSSQARIFHIEGVKVIASPLSVPMPGWQFQTEKEKREESRMPFTPIIIIILVVVLILVLATGLKVVQQSRAYIIKRLGASHPIWGVGIHFKVPFLERVVRVVSLKEQVVDFPSQSVITRGNVTVQTGAVLYFQITDPELYAYGMKRPMSAIENLSVTIMRNIVDDADLKQTLTSRDIINSRTYALLDKATDPQGIKVNRVEIKNIQPPPNIQSTTGKQMKAGREKRKAVLRIKSQRQSQILVAKGEKESMVLRANAAKQAAVKKAEGEAEAILKTQRVTVGAIKLLNEADSREAVLRIKALGAFQATVDDKTIKTIIPSEIRGLAGLCTSAKAMFDSMEPGKPRPPAESRQNSEQDRGHPR